MKNFRFLPLLAILAIAVSAIAPATYKVDTNASYIIWKGYKVTGSHTGTVKLKSGQVQFTDGRLTGGSFEIDMTTIKDTDLGGEMAEKLVGHLKSDDFFGVATYPTAKFVITNAFATDTKGNYRITGNLTIKETTKAIKFDANVSESNGTVNATGNIKIDRSEYNVRYGSGSFFDGLGDKTIYDDFDLQLTLVAKK